MRSWIKIAIWKWSFSGTDGSFRQKIKRFETSEFSKKSNITKAGLGYTDWLTRAYCSSITRHGELGKPFPVVLISIIASRKKKKIYIYRYIQHQLITYLNQRLIHLIDCKEDTNLTSIACLLSVWSIALSGGFHWVDKKYKQVLRISLLLSC